jgi:hypothetical protein
VEWEFVDKTGNGYMLKTEVIELLRQTRKRREDDPYRLFSAHIHSQSSYTVPTIGSLEQVVSQRTVCDECVQLQAEITEYLNEVLLSCFADKWASLPEVIVANARSRLDNKQKAFFS